MLIYGFDARDQECPCRPCWAPGLFEHRGATLSGSRNTGAMSKACLNRANRGCPSPVPVADHAFGQRRRACARCGFPRPSR